MVTKEAFFNEIKSYKFLANKDLGQCFLIDENIAEKIVNLLDLKDGEETLEIGAGFGSLSYFLVKNTAKVHLIDIDERFLLFLNKHFKNHDNVEIRRENILKTDLEKYDFIIGNLPYYITSKILESIALKAVNAKRIVIMCQKEVINKLKNEISPLSLMLNYVAKINYEFSVSRAAFIPQPHVDSYVISITPNANIKSKNNKLLYDFISKMFMYRRKTIENNLFVIIKDREKTKEILKRADVTPDLRPEALKIENFLNLIDILVEEGIIGGN